VARRLGPVNFEDRLTLVQHLDELRTRLIIAGASFIVAFALCLWQNHLLLEIANEPLPGDEQLTTFGVSEPFMTTVTVAAYGAIVLSLPVILYQLYAFILPALTPRERTVALPLLLVIPVLFIAGVMFAYFVVLPAAVKFLLNFNDDQFNIQVRAREYYSFFAITLVALGLLFQIPIVILALTRLGITTPEQLAQNRRYAILVIAVIAMLMPGQDPVTMLSMMLPMVVLYEGSILLAALLDRRAARARAREEAAGAPATDSEMTHFDSDDD
jgi:sec-independent protein translocase protein TatC